MAVMFSLHHMDFVQVSPCNERAVLDQLASYFQRRLAGYQSSNTAEVSSISILNCLICTVDQARVITSPNYPASGQEVWFMILNITNSVGRKCTTYDFLSWAYGKQVCAKAFMSLGHTHGAYRVCRLLTVDFLCSLKTTK